MIEITCSKVRIFFGIRPINYFYLLFFYFWNTKVNVSSFGTKFKWNTKIINDSFLKNSMMNATKEYFNRIKLREIKFREPKNSRNFLDLILRVSDLKISACI